MFKVGRRKAKGAQVGFISSGPIFGTRHVLVMWSGARLRSVVASSQPRPFLLG